MVNPLNNIPSVQPSAPAGTAPKTTAAGLSFSQVFESNLVKGDALKFSAHAQSRLSSRNIQLSTQDLNRIESGVAQAAAKGAKESLVLKDDLALLVSVKNNTVITAVDSASMKNNVFTNIDSAVIV